MYIPRQQSLGANCRVWLVSSSPAFELFQPHNGGRKIWVACMIDKVTNKEIIQDNESKFLLTRSSKICPKIYAS